MEKIRYWRLRNGFQEQDLADTIYNRGLHVPNTLNRWIFAVGRIKEVAPHEVPMGTQLQLICSIFVVILYLSSILFDVAKGASLALYVNLCFWRKHYYAGFALECIEALKPTNFSGKCSHKRWSSYLTIRWLIICNRVCNSLPGFDLFWRWFWPFWDLSFKADYFLL